jgi:hypothetical protein
MTIQIFTSFTREACYEKTPSPEKHNDAEILIYRTDGGKVRLDVRLEDENIWLTQQMMAELFQTSVPNISMHMRNIYEEGERTEEATVKKFLTVRKEGGRQVQRKLDYYNLDMIISVGYRVNSIVATHFRIWATQRLREYIVKGFTMDDERLKNPPVAGSRMSCVLVALYRNAHLSRRQPRRIHSRFLSQLY